MKLKRFIKKIKYKKITPHMTQDEIELFDQIMKNAHNYLEMGGGDSTIYIAKKYKKINSITVIDTDINLLNSLKSDYYIKKLKNKIKLIHANLGKVGEWGWPINEPTKPTVINMWLTIINNLPKELDTILIDGRYRIPATLLFLMFYPNAIFIFHDFIERRYYHLLLNFINIEDFVDTLAICKIKSNINIRDLLTIYMKYQFVGS